MTTYVGAIDPGKTGGWAVYDFETRRLEDAGPIIFDNPRELRMMLDGCSKILIERSQGAKGQANQFEYGRSFGRTEAACIMTGAQILYCAASWWKAKLGVPVDKEGARQMALNRIPGLAEYVTLKGQHGIAEAALLGQILLYDKFYSQLVANNEKRQKPKKKKPSFRL